MSRITREALARAQANIAARQMGEAFIGLDDRRAPPPRSTPDRRQVAAPMLSEAELLDEDIDDTDWYARSNGLSVVMGDGTRVEGHMDD